MHIINDKYIINKDLGDCKEKHLISFSDIHLGYLQQIFYQKTLRKYFNYIYKTKKTVDATLIPGDLIFWIKNYQGKKYLQNLKDTLKEIADTMQSPVIISYGNHDLPFKKELEQQEYWNLSSYIEDRKNGVYVLDNEQLRIQDMVITGFSPSRGAYNPNSMPTKALQEAQLCFQNANFSFNENDLNILMCHENKFFTHPNIINEYKELYHALTLIIGGHLHDGYIPWGIQKMCSKHLKDYGIWEKIPPKINMCRGAFKVSSENVSSVYLPNEKEDTQILLESNETASIINRGVAKYSWFIPGAMSVTQINIDNTRERQRVKKI